VTVASSTTVSIASNNAWTLKVPSYHSPGSVLIPTVAFSSESSLGLYRSAASTLAPSYGTFDLAPNSVRLSVRSLAMASLTSLNIGTNELVLAIGASGCSLAYRSGGTMWYPNSSLSTNG